jgi:hypothetical protein
MVYFHGDEHAGGFAWIALVLVEYQIAVAEGETCNTSIFGPEFPTERFAEELLAAL